MNPAESKQSFSMSRNLFQISPFFSFEGVLDTSMFSQFRAISIISVFMLKAEALFMSFLFDGSGITEAVSTLFCLFNISQILLFTCFLQEGQNCAQFHSKRGCANSALQRIVESLCNVPPCKTLISLLYLNDLYNLANKLKKQGKMLSRTFGEAVVA